MDTAWIQIFVLTLAECVAPAGKSVCQEQRFELDFLSRSECEYALQQMIATRDELEHVIVNRNKSGCASSATNIRTFPSLEAIRKITSENDVWNAPTQQAREERVIDDAHSERLATLKSCEDTNGTPPCKVGDIIVEDSEGGDVEVWRRTD